MGQLRFGILSFPTAPYLDNVILDICAKTRGLPGPSLEPQHGVASLSQADAPLPSQLVQGQEGHNRPPKRCVCRTCV